jgi:adenine specific DNA methylase Mod
MKELAKLRITEVDQRIKQMPSNEIDEKIDLLYSLGYIYNPYIKEFFNPFINKGLKALVIYNLDLKRIHKC